MRLLNAITLFMIAIGIAIGTAACTETDSDVPVDEAQVAGIERTTTGSPAEPEPATGAVAEPGIAGLTIAPGAFVNQHLVQGLACGASEVMVGIHWDRRLAICAQLNYGYQVGVGYMDVSATATQVSSAPSMHGCAKGYFIQAISNLGSSRKDYRCVPVWTSDRQALEYSACTHDGRGPSNNGTQSLIYEITNPIMHACPLNSAMVGLHVYQNDIYCCS